MRQLVLALLAASLIAAGATPPPVIFDTDMAGDVDDTLALAMLHGLETRGECRLVAITVSTDMPDTAAYIDAVNRFYGRAAIPIGMPAPGLKIGDNQGYTRKVLDRKHPDGHSVYPFDTSRKYDDAVRLLRRTLAGLSEKAIVIQVGFSPNLAALLDSAADEWSPLSGRELVAAKVKLLSIMGGEFTGTGKPEYNIEKDIPSAKKLFERWPGPVVASGFEIGLALPYPAQSIVKDFAWTEDHPVADAYRFFEKMPYDRPSWDLTSVLYAIRPEHGYFDLSPAGTVRVDSKGVTTFARGSGEHRYLILRPAAKARVLDSMASLASQPVAGAKALFNGYSLDGWMWTMGGTTPEPSWTARDGTLCTTPKSGTPVYLLTRASFTDFEFSFEWNAEPAANSGVKYRLQSIGTEKRLEPFGLEYQITDDENNPDARSAVNHSTGAIYDYVAPRRRAPARAGVWHQGRIVARGLHIEHWVDGEKVVDADLDASETKASFAQSPRTKSVPVLLKHERRTSPIALQIHDGEVCFRNLYVR